MKRPNLPQLSQQIAALFSTLASPARVAILLAIGRGEACVCHLEAMLGWRQAYISQHLMALRKADILQDRRDGRFIFYRIKNASFLDLITAATSLSGLSAEATSAPIQMDKKRTCACPRCATILLPNRSS
ncbi:MAG TPA: metalloregulator ArsR/SmtB family transcription factor [Anaerolineales bacterium]|nr:metalloregulator ArsR/SmtB family transcription factor [Anaerolineales bacterium]